MRRVALLGESELLLLIGLGIREGLSLTGLLEVLDDRKVLGAATGSRALALPLRSSSSPGDGDGSLEATYRMVDSSRNPLPRKGLTLPLVDTP